MNDTATTKKPRGAWVSGVIEVSVKRRFRIHCAKQEMSMSERINHLVLADLEENEENE